MKKNLFIPLFCLLLTCGSFWSCGGDDDNNGDGPTPPPIVEEFERTVRSIEMKSSILGQTIKYSILFPKDYDKTKTDYGVVYLLHGYGDNENSWLNGGRIENHVDRAVNLGLSKPVILVMPQGYNSYYVNRSSGQFDYMKMITQELVPLIDKEYRTIKDSNHRAVMGYSMGGYGAFILPSLNPDVFSVSIALSMSWRTDAQYMAEPQGVFDMQFGSIFGGSGQAGQGRITEYFKQHSPFHFFNKSNLDQYKKVSYMLDCGDDEEQLSITNDELHTLMLSKGIAHEYRMRNGAHNWDYWSASMDEAFKFIQLSFDKTAFPEEEAEVQTSPDNLKGSYREIAIEGIEQIAGIYLPEAYDTSGLRYPVLYLLHDRKGLSEKESIKKVLSLVESAYVVDGLHQSIVVELPVTATSQEGFAQKLIDHVDKNYRTLNRSSARLLMANNVGGKFVEEVLPYTNGYFLYNAEIPLSGLDSKVGFFYLDMTDQFSGSKAYGNLYAALRAEGIEHQYRVRNGTASYRSFLNGLPASFSYMNSKLDKSQ